MTKKFPTFQCLVKCQSTYLNNLNRLLSWSFSTGCIFKGDPLQVRPLFTVDCPNHAEGSADNASRLPVHYTPPLCEKGSEMHPPWQAWAIGGISGSGGIFANLTGRQFIVRGVKIRCLHQRGDGGHGIADIVREVACSSKCRQRGRGVKKSESFAEIFNG